MRGTKAIGSRYRPGIPAVVLAAAVALAGCGSSGKPHGVSASAGIKFAGCMRSHGVSNFPDPSSGKGGIQITPGSGVNPQSPAFQSAQKACTKFLPGPPSGGRSGSEARKLVLLKLAQCMRRHGFSTFPDPTTSSPTSGPPSLGSRFGLAIGSPGVLLAVPRSLVESPGFKQAAAECNFPGFGGRGGGKQTPAPSG
jgi:hypothetical protein